MNLNDKIYVAGHNGLVGSSLVRLLKTKGFNNLILKSHSELDLLNQTVTLDFFKNEKPDYVFLSAAKVGGIMANNTYPAQFIYENLQIQNSIINASYELGVKKLLFLGSSCIYPKQCSQPIKEEYLLTSPLEPTNEAYALAKIAGIKMCEYYNQQYGTDFISVMPTNLYGPNDNFDLENSHVLPALIRKFHEAKINNSQNVTVWGTGNPKREFLYVDDLAEACVFLMQNISAQDLMNKFEISFLNIGTGVDVSIKELALLIKDVVDFRGEIIWDTMKPDGTPRKLLDVSRVNSLGWKAKIKLMEGVRMGYQWYVDSLSRK